MSDCSVSIETLHKICRFCNSTGNLLTLSTLRCAGIPISDVIFDLMGIQITEDDGFPDRICLECTLLCGNFNEFRQTSRKNNAHLHQMSTGSSDSANISIISSGGGELHHSASFDEFEVKSPSKKSKLDKFGIYRCNCKKHFASYSDYETHKKMTRHDHRSYRKKASPKTIDKVLIESKCRVCFTTIGHFNLTNVKVCGNCQTKLWDERHNGNGVVFACKMCEKVFYDIISCEKHYFRTHANAIINF